MARHLYGGTAVGFPADAEATPVEAAGVVMVPRGVTELRVDLSRERVIRVVGLDRRGEGVERLLKVTGKGKLVLV
jgi:hypothetical protein